MALGNRFAGLTILVLVALGGSVACGASSDGAGSSGGGAGGAGSGGGGAGGSGGAAGAGGSGGGTGGSGGTATGGAGGAAGAGTGGTGTGGTGTGGTGTGGTGTGGTGTGGTGTGGTGTGGTGGTGGGSPGNYTVGGSVTGLAGTGLVLQNNGGDNLAITSNGTFTFATSVATGQPYAVTVSTQPSSPTQTCAVQNGSGTMGTANVGDVAVTCTLIDSDNDKVPDVADPFPNDPTKPKVALPSFVYPHTASELFTMDVKTYAIAKVGNFNGPTYSGSMTDLAVDQWGVIYGVTFGELFTCDSTTATCYVLATLPQSFNGLTMLPPGTHHPYLDTLVGIAISGTWYKITLGGSGTAQLTQIGQYGGGYTSSGDAFSIESVGTFAAVDKPGVSWDVVVSVDPMTGAVLSEIGQLNGYSSVYGLAGWQGEVFGFDASGAVLKIDTSTGVTSILATTNHPWWGAGVATRLMQ